ncbi:DUF362 domain-containing protein [Opitutaceae bacterium TAV4]|nr:DUF362 domain-containing protein [Opitutaceae bacterium TAV4]RRK01679.1 DUF362 domain-containing protein [Opitutaceae bacterium TAV3]
MNTDPHTANALSFTLTLALVLMFFVTPAIAALPSPPETESTAPAIPPLPAPNVWEASLPTDSTFVTPGPQSGYDAAVEALFAACERTTGRKLQPGEKRKAGIKIYTDAGPGLATPKPLVRAVITALQRRGFAAGDIFLVGLNPLRLRMAGYLPSSAAESVPFEGHPVFVLESGRFYDPVWFYDSPIPYRFDPILSGRNFDLKPVNRMPGTDLFRSGSGGDSDFLQEDDRKSFLATPLFLDTDFWINLPVYSDHDTLGVNGALANATLWNASNTTRFFRSAATAPAAVAEMAAIPELRLTWALTLTSLERWQFIGGPHFNSLYTVSEPRLLLSADPVAIDSVMLGKINRARQAAGFKPVPDDVRTLEFAETLGVGTRHPPPTINVTP